MKAEERKALEHNDLADQLNRAYETLKQGPSRGTVWFVGITAAVLLVAGLFYMFYRSSEASASQRWLKLDDVVFTQQLEIVEKESDLKDTPQGRLLRFKDARVKLTQGFQDLANDTTRAVKRIEDAKDEYEKLIKSAGRVPLLHQEALSGAAKANEALGEIDAAIEHYKTLVGEYKDSALGIDAAKQLARLTTEAGRTEARELARKLLKK
jgi:tetratricopeptide (TPR) repeat protein